MSSCSHVWEDAQLRTTKDGMYIASFDYCAKCGEPLSKMKAAPLLLEALEDLAATFVVEQDDWDNDHLWYLCNECDARVVDDPDLIEHESDCRVGLAISAIAKASGDE